MRLALAELQGAVWEGTARSQTCFLPQAAWDGDVAMNSWLPAVVPLCDGEIAYRGWACSHKPLSWSKIELEDGQILGRTEMSTGPSSVPCSAWCPLQTYSGKTVAKALGVSPHSVRYVQEQEPTPMSVRSPHIHISPARGSINIRGPISSTEMLQVLAPAELWSSGLGRADLWA